MSGTVASSYSAPIDFRIGPNPPVILDIAGTNLAISDIYAFANQTIRAFTDLCGIGQQLPSQWTSLAGNTKTLTCGNLNRFYVTANEAIAFGSIINLFNVGGKIAARNANATSNAKPADGFCSTSNGIAAGAVGEVTLASGVALIGGLVVGQRYWLSTTNGIIANTPAVAAGNIEQMLGIAIDVNHFFFNCSPFWLQH